MTCRQQKVFLKSILCAPQICILMLSQWFAFEWCVLWIYLSYALANQRKFSQCCVSACQFVSTRMTIEGGSVKFAVYNALHRLFPISIHVEPSTRQEL